MGFFYVPVGVDEDSAITLQTSLGQSATSTQTFDLVVQPPTISDIVYGGLPDPQQARVGDYVLIKGHNFCSSECLQPGSTETLVCLNGLCSAPAWTGWDLLTVQVPVGVDPGLQT